MTRFQLVFRHSDGERSEIRDNNTDGDPQLDGTLIVAGRGSGRGGTTPGLASEFRAPPAAYEPIHRFARRPVRWGPYRDAS